MAKLNYRRIPDALRTRETFEGNSMYAVRMLASHVSTGQLSGDDLKAFRAIQGEAYVVKSYNTPIAWITEDGTVTIPDTKYSATTSRQQNLCRAWL